MQLHPPLPSSEGCGRQPARELGVEKCEGGPRKWAQMVRHKNGQRHLLLPVFSHSFFLGPLLTPVRPRLRPLPPPSRPNASRRWFFLYFRHVTHHHRLPRIQTRARGGVFRSFRCFDASPTTSTSLASKCEPEVVFSYFRHVTHHHRLPRVQTRARGGFFRSFDTRQPPPPPPSGSHPNASRRWCFLFFDTSPITTSCLASKHEPEVVFFGVSTCHPPPPPPSRPNASRRWFFSFFSSFRCVTHHLHPPSCPNASRRWCFLFFRHITHHHLLPRIQTQAGGGVFRRFDASPTTSTSLTSKREPVVLFVSFDATPTTSTSLASKREPEVVIFSVSMCLPPLSPPLRPNASWRWSISAISMRLPPSPPPSHPQRGGVHTTCHPI